MGVFAGFIGQLVLPGTYNVKVKAGDFSDVGTLILLPDPLQPDLDYAKRRATSDEIFGLVEDLGLLVAQVQNLKDSADQRLTLTKGKKLTSDLTEFSKKLEEFRKTLTETVESKGITGEQQLRARLGKLYVFAEMSDNLVTKSVLDGVSVIREELQQAHTKAGVFFGKELEALNAALKKEKILPLVVIDQEAWNKQSGASVPASGKGGNGRAWMGL
jgi:nitrate reductase beta subunit